jgi:ABC-2 type transport system permease protein
MRRLSFLIRKEFIQVFRSRPMLGIIFGMPLIQLIIIGFAISGDVEHVPSAVIDLDNSVKSRALVEKLSNSRYIDILYRPRGSRAAENLLGRGEVILAVTIPSGFERDMARGEHPAIFIEADAQNTNVALTGVGYVTRIIRSWAVGQSKHFSQQNDIRIHTINTDIATWYNPSLKSIYFMVPAVMVILVTVITMLLTALAIVRERGENNSLEQLMVTPISRLELILGKTIPFGILGMVELTLAIILIRVVYGITIAGNLPEFYLMSGVFMISSIGIGIFISTVTTTQQQALFTTWFVLVFCLLMCGFFLPLDNMPRTLYQFTYINPLRYYMTIVREVFIKGAGISDLWVQTLALLAIGCSVLGVAVARFRKNIG